MSKPSQRQFELKLSINAPRDLVWQAIASDAGLSNWFAPENSIEPRQGGALTWKWGAAHTWAQRIEVCEPGVRLTTRYDSSVMDADGQPEPLYVEFLLEGEAGATSLRLTHSGFGAKADFDQEFDGISCGWPVELNSLKFYLEQHATQERQLVWSHLDVPNDPGATWKSMLGPEGLNCGTEIAELQPGDPYQFTTSDGDTFRGTILLAHNLGFVGLDKSHGGSFLKVHADPGCGAWLWLAAYGQPAEAIAALQAKWDAMLERIEQGVTA